MSRWIVFSIFYCSAPLAFSLPKGFVYLHDVAPSIIEDLRYATSNNFVGQPMVGYKTARCILSQAAAEQLARAQLAAVKKGYSLKVYDCYRPQTTVNAFYKWSQNPNDTRMKSSFYPREDKKQLFNKGYIAQASGHSRGSTIDLTLVSLAAKKMTMQPKIKSCHSKTSNYLDDNSIDTGTRFDCFDISAQVFYPHLSTEQKRNRMLLRSIMLDNGFAPYAKEWWHFTLKKEPFPNTYYDFPVS